MWGANAYVLHHLQIQPTSREYSQNHSTTLAIGEHFIQLLKDIQTTIGYYGYQITVDIESEIIKQQMWRGRWQRSPGGKTSLMWQVWLPVAEKEYDDHQGDSLRFQMMTCKLKIIVNKILRF